MEEKNADIDNHKIACKLVDRFLYKHNLAQVGGGEMGRSISNNSEGLPIN